MIFPYSLPTGAGSPCPAPRHHSRLGSCGPPSWASSSRLTRPASTLPSPWLHEPIPAARQRGTEMQSVEIQSCTGEVAGPPPLSIPYSPLPCGIELCPRMHLPKQAPPLGMRGAAAATRLDPIPM